MLSAKTLGKSLGKSLNVLNDSRLFAGRMLFKHWPKYNIPLSPVQEKYVKTTLVNNCLYSLLLLEVVMY